MVDVPVSYQYELKAGTSAKQVLNDLQALGLLKHPNYLYAWLRVTNQAKHLQAGFYRIGASSTPFQLLKQLKQGDVITYQQTLIEGWTVHEVLDALKNNKDLVHQLTIANENELMQALPYPDQHPEGLFFPDTYQFTYQTTDIAFLTRAYQTMQEKLNQAWKNRAPDLPYQNPYEALIVASLLEKEASVESERLIIADIILKRLKKDMRLQIDPSVIYGLGKAFKGELTKKDLKMESPYNTYLHKGLPPTPIALPSEQAIQAALHPQSTDTLYFVSKGDGSHYFSSTLEEHHAAVAKYR